MSKLLQRLVLVAVLIGLGVMSVHAGIRATAFMLLTHFQRF